MNSYFYFLLFILGVIVSGFSQVILKKGANKNYTGIRVYLNFYVILGYFIYFCINYFANT